MFAAKQIVHIFLFPRSYILSKKKNICKCIKLRITVKTTTSGQMAFRVNREETVVFIKNIAPDRWTARGPRVQFPHAVSKRPRGPLPKEIAGQAAGARGKAISTKKPSSRTRPPDKRSVYPGPFVGFCDVFFFFCFSATSAFSVQPAARDFHRRCLCPQKLDGRPCSAFTFSFFPLLPVRLTGGNRIFRIPVRDRSGAVSLPPSVTGPGDYV